MSKILLIETATEVCGAAISVDGEVVAIREDPDAQNHAALLTLQIKACLREANLGITEIDAVAVSAGPGSYTSLRVGVATAKGICYALNKPLIAVNTLQALAKSALDWYQGAPESDPSALAEIYLAPMLDARRKEVWAAVYNTVCGEISAPGPLILGNNLFDIFLRDIGIDQKKSVLILSGNGSFKLENDLNEKGTVISPIKKCSARFLAHWAEKYVQQGDFQDVSRFEPFYMKPPNITTSAQAKI